MKTKSLAILVLAGIAVAFSTGCGNPAGGSSGSGGSSALIVSLLNNQPGLIEIWPTAAINGSETYPVYNCDSETDASCILDFATATTPQGQFTLYSLAIPATWNLAGLADVNCQSGGTWSGTITSSDETEITCGQWGLGSAIVSPTSCTTIVNYDTGQIEHNNCPSSVTLTFPAGTETFPTSHAMTVGTYDVTGTSESSDSITASSSTTISVPLPGEVGNSAIIVVDPSTNKIIGSGLFTRIQTIYYPCGRAKSC
jgi:hypothetical protein